VAHTYRDAVTATTKDAFGLILCRDSLPDGNWKDLLSHVIVLPESPHFVLLAKSSDQSLWAEAINLGAYDVIAEPVNQLQAEEMIRRALTLHARTVKIFMRRGCSSCRSSKVPSCQFEARPLGRGDDNRDLNGSATGKPIPCADWIWNPGRSSVNSQRYRTRQRPRDVYAAADHA